jgi:hypothetical protein
MTCFRYCRRPCFEDRRTLYRLRLRRLGAGISPQRPGFDPGPVHVRCVMNQVAPSTSVSPVSIIPPMLHTHLRLHISLTRRTNARNLYRKQCLISAFCRGVNELSALLECYAAQIGIPTFWNFFLGCLTLEDRLSLNVGNYLPNYAA